MYLPDIRQDRFQDVWPTNYDKGFPVQTGDDCNIRSEIIPATQQLLDMFTVRWTTNKIQFLASAAGVRLGEGFDA